MTCRIIGASVIFYFSFNIKKIKSDFPGGSVVKNLPASTRDPNSVPDLGRSHTPWSN